MILTPTALAAYALMFLAWCGGAVVLWVLKGMLRDPYRDPLTGIRVCVFSLVVGIIVALALFMACIALIGFII